MTTTAPGEKGPPLGALETMQAQTMMRTYNNRVHHPWPRVLPCPAARALFTPFRRMDLVAMAGLTFQPPIGTRNIKWTGYLRL